MKKSLFYLLIFCVMLSVMGCEKKETNDLAPTEEMTDEVISINAAEYYRKKSNEFTEAYYLGDALTLDWTGSVERYVASGKASAELVQNYQLSDSMEVLPVLGQYLESTRLAVYLFYRDGALSGCATLAMDTTLNERQIEEFSHMDEQDHWYAEALSDEDCFLTISECRKNYPDFRILGIVFQTDGYPCVIPVGKMEGETSVKMVFGSLTEFRLVAPFQTIEQGRQAFEEYFDQKDKMLSDVIIYPWLKNPQNDGYFLRRYENQGCELPEYFLEYDNWVDIPLMDEQLEENHYTLYLLFQGNALIAEVVLARDGERFEIAWENAAPKDENGSYQTIEKSKYERIYSAATGIMPQSDICGVIFKDNDFHPYIKQGSMVQYYEADKNAFVNG